MNPSSLWPFPMECPACKAVTGKPYRAETAEEHGSIRVILRCMSCHHEWPAEFPSRKVERSSTTLGALAVDTGRLLRGGLRPRWFAERLHGNGLITHLED